MHCQVGNGAMPFSLEFASRTTIKSQALVDFIIEWTDLSMPTSQGPDEY